MLPSIVPNAALQTTMLMVLLLSGCVPGSGAPADRSESERPEEPATAGRIESKQKTATVAQKDPAGEKSPLNVEKESVAAAAPPPSPPPQIQAVYPWQSEIKPEQTIVARLPTPKGFIRVGAPAGSFANWLRTLPMKPGRPPVHLHNGRLKGNQSAQELVIDMDVGERDLQQCADAVMRLRAEYLFSQKRFDAIHFNFTTGDRASYSKWRQGYRPQVKGNRVSWRQTGAATATYQGFKSYLQSVFTYAGTASLTRGLSPRNVNDIQPGDVFIRGGFPGHAVIVIDVARDKKGNNPIFLLAQSYMPAQEMHVLRNPTNSSISPWYSAHFGDVLETPEWDFKRSELKAFRDE